MTKFITPEQALATLLDTLVSPLLAKLLPFSGIKAIECELSAQMMAVAWVYNYHLCQEITNLEALSWEDICRKGSVLQPKLLKFLGKSETAASEYLTPMEHNIKRACEAVEAIKASSNIKKVTKICVCLLNFRLDKCVLVLGAAAVGTWSLIEKSRYTQATTDGLDGIGLSDEEFAHQAVEEQTGIKTNVLQLEDDFLVNDDLNEGCTKFYIASCSGTFDLCPAVKLEKIGWISLDTVFHNARGFLIEALDSTFRSTPALQYFRLRPFCSYIESWITRKKCGGSLQLVKSRPEKCPIIAWKPEVKPAANHDLKGQGEVSSHQAVLEGSLYQIQGMNDRRQLLNVNGRTVGSSPSRGIASAAQSSMSSKTMLVNQGKDEKRQLLNVNGETVGSSPSRGTGNAAPSSMSSKGRTELSAQSSQNPKELHSKINQMQEPWQKQLNLPVKAVGVGKDIGKTSTQTATVGQNVAVQCTSRNVHEVLIPASRQFEENRVKSNEFIKGISVPMCISAHRDSPESSMRSKRKEETLIFEKEDAHLKMERAYRSIRKKRKILSKKLSDHTVQADELYKQIAECDKHWMTLMGGGKAGLQLAIDVCKEDDDGQISDSRIDCRGTLSQMNYSGPETMKQGDKSKGCFRMLKNSIQELNEVCAKNGWAMPSFGVLVQKNNKGNNQYRCKVRIRNNDFELSESGEASDSSRAAKLSAAAYMLSTLHLLKARNTMS
ncbi:hypothetical protein KP509_21G026800 [Ceratopteris richardii]|uniref:Uncharacterized protein n=2 Tax=Ceratopteris richardii TaxID=49495 RepID=A0A8T2SBS6_CERRI|nr:hypothetical protein KP509_21G026800 [Ceratopteris richardii]